MAKNIKEIVELVNFANEVKEIILDIAVEQKAKVEVGFNVELKNVWSFKKRLHRLFMLYFVRPFYFIIESDYNKIITWYENKWWYVEKPNTVELILHIEALNKKSQKFAQTIYNSFTNLIGNLK